jgi:hypothetical protein
MCALSFKCYNIVERSVSPIIYMSGNQVHASRPTFRATGEYSLPVASLLRLPVILTSNHLWHHVLTLAAPLYNWRPNNVKLAPFLRYPLVARDSEYKTQPCLACRPVGRRLPCSGKKKIAASLLSGRSQGANTSGVNSNLFLDCS